MQFQKKKKKTCLEKFGRKKALIAGFARMHIVGG
jgi:hypothetical protein